MTTKNLTTKVVILALVEMALVFGSGCSSKKLDKKYIEKSASKEVYTDSINGPYKGNLTGDHFKYQKLIY